MSSDGYFEDDMDSAVFQELDAIEAAHNSPAKPSSVSLERSAPHFKDDDLFDLSFDVDESELQRLDNFVNGTYQERLPPIAGSTNSKGMLQTTLDGNVLRPKTSSSSSGSASRTEWQRTKSIPRNPFGQQAPKTKQWDQTAFAKSGLKRGKSKGKGKAKASFDPDEEDEEDEDVEFEQFPAPFVSSDPPPPMKLKPDLLEAKHWIYPLNKPKRAYQFNIANHCLFENTLVALPTGLGKTFIAGVVMLNFYRWFPEGKVVFVAPTKPLVAQQIEACHRVCGIPASDTMELTGQVPKPARARAWKDRRVFFMTPQTLINDLTSENCDVSSVVLIVIDEAHRGTGDYAYAQIVRFLMAKNPHFRVLALTATPGNTPDAVQNIVDSLHISRIEIRDESSLDLKDYIHKKTTQQHIIPMSEDITRIRDSLAKLMNATIQPLKNRGVFYGQSNPVTMTAFLPQHISHSLKQDQKWAYAPLAKLSTLARSMGYLIEASAGMCYTHLQNIASHDNDGENGKKAAKATKLRSDPLFQAVMKEIETQRIRGFSVHPKMDMLKLLILQHFDNVDQGKHGKETRVMVFVTYRECVDEIVDILNLERPLIQATKFIGQGTDKQGKRGFAQKEQLEVIKKFKAGEYNVLVSTSIGEEGLDIGEIDLIVCYDSQKSPIRMLQRVGRTGREREGFVHVLLSEGREEFNLEKSKDAYKEVQKAITHGTHLELYADVERLLPDHVKPECLEKVMEIEEFVREEKKKKKGSAANECGSPEKGTKRKRNDDIGRNIPAGASTGFVSVADLVMKKAKKRRKVSAKAFDSAGQDDDTDLDIEAGSILNPPHRTVSTSTATSSSTPEKISRKSTTKGVKKAPMAKKKRLSKKSAQPELTSSQFLRKGVDDSDDLEIRNYTAPSRLEPTSECLTPPPPPERPKSSKHPPACPNLPMADKSIILISSDDERFPLSPSPPGWAVDVNSGRATNSFKLSESRVEFSVDDSLIASPDGEREHKEQNMAWLVDEDDDPDIEIIESSPIVNRKRPATPDDDPDEFLKDISLSPLKSNNLLEHTSNYRHVQESNKVARSPFRPDESIEFIMDNSIPGSPPNQILSLKSTPAWRLSSSPSPKAKKDLRKFDMPPPDLPSRKSPVSVDYDYLEPSFPVRPAGKPHKRIVVEPQSPALDMPLPSQRRLRRLPSPHSPQQRKAKNPTVDRNNHWIDMEAIHSGDDSMGSSYGEDEVEDEDDRLFLQNLPESQVSPSYDQSLAYRQSLLSQAPSGRRAPVFANRPIRRGPFAGGSISTVGRRRFMSSSPRADDDQPDEYAVGSFVVDDDAEISFVGNSSNEL